MRSKPPSTLVHGHNRRDGESLTYCSWRVMRSRCLNPRFRGYQRYGGAGITICDRWSDFSAFLEDMGPRPSREYTIDRIDSKGNYEPGNCRWATQTVQNRNRTNNRRLTYNGETLTLAEWGERMGLGRGTIRSRIDRGLSVKDSLTRPIGWRRL